MNAGRFVLAAILIAILCAPASLLVWSVRAAMQCNQGPRSDVFLAYCSNRYGDFEHAAYALGLEPKAVQSLEQADVVVLGTSLVQFALSTRATDHYFSTRHLRHYLFGFGYTESSAFPLKVMSTLPMKAKVYIIHASFTFTRDMSQPARELSDGSAWPRNVARKAGAALVDNLCGDAWCGGTPSIYRRTDNGHWVWQNVLKAPQGAFEIPIFGPSDLPLPTEENRAVADQMLKKLGVGRDCIIVTTTQTATYDPFKFAASMADHMGVAFIAPRLSGLRSIDTAHFDQDSAERWSEAFFREASPIIERCAAKGT